MLKKQESLAIYKWSNWDEVELRHLKYAIAVTQKQGFTNAAAYLEIDQGFLSKQIKWLEKKKSNND